MKEWLILSIIAIVMIAVICVPLALFIPRASNCADLNYTYEVQTLDATYYTNTIVAPQIYVYSNLITLIDYCLYGKTYNTTINVLPITIKEN